MEVHPCYLLRALRPSPAPGPSPSPSPGPASGGPAAITPPAAAGRVLTVGPSGQQYTTLTAAIAASQDGDTIEVQPATYTDDYPGAINTKITIEGVGGLPHFASTQVIPNQKAVLVTNTDVTLYNLEISGAFVTDGDGDNGAAIRQQSGNLTIKNCYFHDNQEGILTGGTEFARNGNAPSCNNGGCTHNINVGHILQFTVTNSYFFAANTGHEIKSRALNSTIKNCVIADGADGTGSYSIDFPNGGNEVVSGNFIEKGPNAGNPWLITIGEEGSLQPSSIAISNNILVNDLGASAGAIRNAAMVAATISNNSFYALAGAQILSDPNGDANTVTGNTMLAFEPLPLNSWSIAMPSPWPTP